MTFLLNNIACDVYCYALVVFSSYITAALVAERYPRSRSLLRWVAYGGLVMLQGWWHFPFITDPQFAA